MSGLINITDWISKEQLSVIEQGLKGEEKEYFREKLSQIELLVYTMPKTYETDGQGEDAVVQLHYFLGGSDWYIIEKDSEREQIQAFGYAILNGDKEMAELGYINIQELIKNGVEIDLHWSPKPLKEVRSV